MDDKIIDLLESNGNQFMSYIQIKSALMKYISPFFPSYYYIHLKIMYDDVAIGETEFRLEEKTMNKLFNS